MTAKLPCCPPKARTELLHGFGECQRRLTQGLVTVMSNRTRATPSWRVVTPVDNGNLPCATHRGDQLTNLPFEIPSQGHLEGPGLIAHISDSRCAIVGSCSQCEEVCADLDAIGVV